MAEDWNAMLERQVAYFSSDQRLAERAEAVRDASPAERWAAMCALCEASAWFLARNPGAMEPEPRSPEIIAILEAMQAMR